MKLTKNAKAYLTGILCICVVSLLFGCQKGESEKPADTIETADTSSEYLYIAKDGASDFYVIRSDFAEKQVVDVAVGIRKSISDVSGAEIGISTDWEKNPTYEHEIIVDETLREQTGYKIDRIVIGKNGYIIKEDNGKIYIAGGTASGTAIGAEYFLTTFVEPGKSSGEIKIPTGYEKIVYQQYDIPDLFINMNKVDNLYKIIVPENAKADVLESAEYLKNTIYDRTGIMLTVSNDKSGSDKAFVISSEIPEIGGVNEIYVDGQSIIFKSSAKSGVSSCVKLFVKKYLEGKIGKYNFPSDYHYLDLGDYIIVTYPNKNK